MCRRLPLLFAAVFASSALTPLPALAQTVVGSGVAPSEAQNTATRPIAFAQSVPIGAALAVVVTSAEIPPGLDLPADTASHIAAQKFTGEAGTKLAIPTGAGNPPVMLFGVGAEDDERDWRVIGGTVAQAWQDEDREIAIVGLPDAEAMAKAALGAQLGQYRFDRYKSDRTVRPAQPLTVVGAGAQAAWQVRRLGSGQ